MKTFQHKKTTEILQIFEELSKIPRCSKQEQKIRQWLVDWAASHNFEARCDVVGNVLIKVPASKDSTSSKPVVIQGHMDMVCEKLPESKHDFTKDPIQLLFDGGWLTADGTTLGADNGIALAIGLALAADPTIPHPPLELLYTVEEEIGLTGVDGLDPDFLEGRILLNLDSEGDEFIIGCAGGKNTEICLPLEYEEVPAHYRPYQIKASEMRGGHSGVDIHRQRANAIQVLGRVLRAAVTEGDLRVSFIHGGTVSNAIPRDAEAILFLPDEAFEQYTESLSTMETVLRTEFYRTDPELTVTLKPYRHEHDNRGMTPACSKKVIDFLLAVPHGVAAMATDIDDLVETSNNFATVTVEKGTLKIMTSQRSSVLSRLLAHTDRIEAIARLAAGEAHSTKGYPAWEANWDSALIDMCQHVSQQLFQKPATISIIHGGLECGMIADKYPDMEAISFGPTIQNAHSPDERLEIGSIGRVWDLLLALLQKLK